MLNKCQIVILCAWIAILNSMAAPTSYYARRLSNIDGVWQTTIYDIYQDEVGNLWFATKEGVLKYNGLSAVPFSAQPADTNALYSPNVSQINGDKNGHVYIIAYYLHEYNMADNTFRRISESSVTALCADSSYVYYSSQNKLFRYDIDKQTTMPLPTRENLNINAIRLTIQKDKLYVGCMTGDAYVYQDSLTYIGNFGSRISDFIEDDDQSLWIATQTNNLFHITSTGWHNVRVSSSTARTLLKQDSLLYIGTKAGLDVYNLHSHQLEHLQLYQEGSSHYNPSIWKLYQDTHGTIWIGTYFNGISYFTPSQDGFKFHNLPLINYHFPIVNSVIPLSDNHYFVATEGDGLCEYFTNSKKINRYIHNNQDINSIASDNIKCSYYDKQQQIIYLGLHLGDLCAFSLKTCTFTRYRLPFDASEWSHIVQRIYPYKNDLLLATPKGVMSFNRKTKSIKPFDHVQRHSYNGVEDITQDDHGNLWFIGTNVDYYNTTTQQYMSYSLANIGTPVCACTLGDSIYIGIDGQGVYVSSIHHWNPQPLQGLSSLYIHNLSVLSNRKLLFVTSRGVSLFDPQTQQMQNYDNSNSLPLSSCYNGACTILDENKVLVVGMDGYVTFDPNHFLFSDTASRTQTRLIIDNVVINGNAYHGNIKEIVLPYKGNLRVEIGSDNYAKRPLFYYTIDDSNPLPLYGGVLQVADLRRGTHLVTIIAIDSSTSQPLVSDTIKIRQKSTIYLSIGAFVIYALIIFVILYLVIKATWEYRKKKFIASLTTTELNFIERLNDYIEANLQNEYLNVDALVKALGISRSRLYEKMKVLLQTTPNDLILQRRLEHAERLMLQHPDQSVAQVAYDSGFTSPTYFATCFKKVYHCSPTEYKNRIKH